MAYVTTRDLLNQVRDFHQKLCHCYAEMSELTNRQKLKMLLDYMSWHEEWIEKSLGQYEADAAERILNAWFQFPPHLEREKAFAGIECGPEMDVDDVVKAVLQFDSCVIEFYREAAQRATHEDVRDLFNRLKAMETHEERQAVINALAM
jgi:rubrerythrin